MKNLNRQEFEQLANAGAIHKPTGQTLAGEDLCESALEYGLANGYSLADICHFYAHAQRKMSSFRKEGLSKAQVFDAAYDRFVQDVVALAGTLLDAAKGIEQRAMFGSAREMLRKALKPFACLGRLFL